MDVTVSGQFISSSVENLLINMGAIWLDIMEMKK